ncbi:MAG: shikimate dehydrogenase [Bacteroidota bacterium]
MKLFGLIGYPLSHSFSSSYFANKYKNEGIEDCEYQLFPIKHISEINELIKKNDNLEGFNITIPYKKEIIPYLTSINSVASEVGAVNTVKIIRNNGIIELCGFNTDVIGFENSIKPLLNGRNKALILGTGGAALAVQYVLNRLHISSLFVSRNADNDKIDNNLLSKKILNEYTIIINTTPVGMFPNISDAPEFPYLELNSNHLLYDLIYNPTLTQFLRNGVQQGCSIKNGLEMLQIQAEEAWKIWTI